MIIQSGFATKRLQPRGWEASRGAAGPCLRLALNVEVSSAWCGRNYKTMAEVTGDTIELVEVSFFGRFVVVECKEQWPSLRVLASRNIVIPFPTHSKNTNGQRLQQAECKVRYHKQHRKCTNVHRCVTNAGDYDPEPV